MLFDMQMMQNSVDSARRQRHIVDSIVIENEKSGL